VSQELSADGVSGSAYLRGQIARELAAAIGTNHVSTDPEDLQANAADWSWYSKYLTYKSLTQPAADFVVKPATTAEVERIVQIASDYKIPLVPRGGGSGTQGGTFAPYGGIALDLSRLTDIVDIDEQSLIVTVGAGIDGPTLEEKLNEKGLTLAHYPGSYHLGATIGGFIAARGSGVVSTKYGKAEDQVLQLEVVVAPGKTIKTLPVPSHAAGSDLLQSFVGSEGTLGVITQASLRIDPLPEARGFLSFSFPDIFAGIEAGRRIMTNRLRPAVIRLYD
jgi:alkyldihydroxyacetonephosphate synthase